MTLKVLLVDDEPLALRGLTSIVRTIADIELVGTATNGAEALHEARRHRPDVVVLDVEMPELDGMAAARHLAADPAIDVIFCTAFNHYAADAFVVDAVDYLVKPVRPARLMQAFDRVRRRRAAPRDADPGADGRPTLAVPHRDGDRHVAIADLIWIEAARDYVVLHTALRSHMLRATMSDMADRLPTGFRRVHRSAFVALDKTVRLDRGEGEPVVVMCDGSRIRIGPSYLKAVRSVLGASGGR